MTFRQLLLRAEGAWRKTACMMAVTLGANGVKRRGGGQFTEEDFYLVKRPKKRQERTHADRLAAWSGGAKPIKYKGPAKCASPSVSKI